MGTSVYPVLGRVKRSIQQTLIGEGSFLNLAGLRPEDFEFLEPDADKPDINGNVCVHLYDNYPVFSWIAAARGSTKPLADHEENNARSVTFFEWLSIGQPSYLDKRRERADYTDFQERYTEGWSHHQVRAIDWLLSFNYDTVAQVYVGHDLADDNGFGPHPELKTYREIFHGKGYFEFLQSAKERDWDFIIFQFD